MSLPIKDNTPYFTPVNPLPCWKEATTCMQWHLPTVAFLISQVICYYGIEWNSSIEWLRRQSDARLKIWVWYHFHTPLIEFPSVIPLFGSSGDPFHTSSPLPSTVLWGGWSELHVDNLIMNGVLKYKVTHSEFIQRPRWSEMYCMGWLAVSGITGWGGERERGIVWIRRWAAVEDDWILRSLTKLSECRAGESKDLLELSDDNI